MGILEERPKNYKTGDAITANVFNDTLDTAIHAHYKARTASAEAQLAESNSQAALDISKKALGDSAEAMKLATAANNNVADMLGIVNNAVMHTDSGSSNAAFVPTQGMYGFRIVDGNLMLNYSGDTEPRLNLNSNGELIYSF